MNQMIQTAKENGLPEENIDSILQLLASKGNMFHITFSSGLPASVSPMVIELLRNAQPVSVRI